MPTSLRGVCCSLSIKSLREGCAALPWPRGAGAAARTAGEALGRDVVLGEPRLFIERRPREPPR